MYKIKVSVAVQTDIAEMLSTSSSSSSSRSTSEPDLLAAWSDLLAWSENSAEARKLQEEILLLKNTLNRLGQQTSLELLDTEPALQIAIEALKNEKSQLQAYRSKMLRLNASVHRWLTRPANKLQKLQQQQQSKETANVAGNDIANELIASTTSTTTTASSTTTTSTTVVTVTDNNGNKVETQSYANVVAAAAAAADAIDSKSAATTTTTASETTQDSLELELHNHLKNEVTEMYSAWDEADGRINAQLEMLTTSLVTWRQFENGLSEFQHALGQDRGTLKGLEGALNKGQATPNELAQNVKLVAKLLSEKVNVSQAQLSAAKEHLDPQHILNITQFTTSSGSLSDSGISDGGAISDGGLSERERRLGVLRRLAKQLECALAPGSEAMKSIAARMESAEAELKQLQNTCRDLIVRTASTHENNKKQQQQQQQQNEKAGFLKANGHAGGSKSADSNANSSVSQTNAESPTKRKNKQNKKAKKSGLETTLTHEPMMSANGNAVDDETLVDGNGNNAATTAAATTTTVGSKKGKSVHFAAAAAASPPDDSGDPYDDPPLEFDLNDSNGDGNGDDGDGGRAGRKHGWMSRITRAAVPLQMALVTFLFAAAMMQPNCCDNINNMAYSFTPQLRYIRGPPPI